MRGLGLRGLGFRMLRLGLKLFSMIYNIEPAKDASCHYVAVSRARRGC